MELIEALKWRHAIKKYSNKKVPDEKLDRIIAAINLSASSFGLQPYRLFIIESTDLRKELGLASFNPQITEASHLLVFAAYDSITTERIDEYVDLIAKEREVPIESLTLFKEKTLERLLLKTDSENFLWATKQAYIALGTGLIAAAMEQVDATPMEGFHPERFDELLELKEKGLKSVALMALGYRDEEHDRYSKLKKVRWPKEEFALFIS